MINSIYYQEQHCKRPSLHIHSYFPILSFNLLSLYTLFYSFYASFLLTKHTKKLLLLLLLLLLYVYTLCIPPPLPFLYYFLRGCMFFFSSYSFIFNLCLIGRFCFSSSLFSFSNTRDKKKQKKHLSSFIPFIRNIPYIEKQKNAKQYI